MGHHLTKDRKFLSDKFKLPENVVGVKICRRTWVGLRLVAIAYSGVDPEFSEDLVLAIDKDQRRYYDKNRNKK